tara:strand:- start:305 stop:1072 length:768 start_codon:yes stop_codon:yes gene_type:complete
VFDNTKSLKNFIKNYKKNNAGIKHNLLICFKLLGEKKISSLKKILNGVNYIEFIDNFPNNDFDFGSYHRVALKYHSHIIFFLNSHSYPLKKNWLKILMLHYNKKSIIGTSGSYESLFSALKLKKLYKFFSYFYRYVVYKNKFKPFPNPHIRTASFLINGSDFITFIKNHTFLKKEDTWCAESGINSLTNFFKNKKYKIFIVNSDGMKFTENFWKFSETYNYQNQSKSLISDKHSRKYLKLSSNERLISSLKVWGD